MLYGGTGTNITQAKNVVVKSVLLSSPGTVFTAFIIRKFDFNSDGFDALFLVAVALLSYSAPTLIGGNGYLSVYLTGIILGNTRIRNKQSLVHFFDGITGFMQILLFFLPGLLSFPSQFSNILIPALGIALFLTLVARPIVVFCLLTPLRR